MIVLWFFISQNVWFMVKSTRKIIKKNLWYLEIFLSIYRIWHLLINVKLNIYIFWFLKYVLTFVLSEIKIWVALKTWFTPSLNSVHFCTIIVKEKYRTELQHKYEILWNHRHFQEKKKKKKLVRTGLMCEQ